MPSLWKYLFGSKTSDKTENEENIRESVVKVEDQEWVIFEEAAVDLKSQPIFAPTLSSSFEQIRNNTPINSERLWASENSSAGNQSNPVIESPPPATAATPEPSTTTLEQRIAIPKVNHNQELVNALWGNLEVDTSRQHNKADVIKENKRRERMTKNPPMEKKARHSVANQQRGQREKQHGKVQKNRKM